MGTKPSRKIFRAKVREYVKSYPYTVGCFECGTKNARLYYTPKNAIGQRDGLSQCSSWASAQRKIDETLVICKNCAKQYNSKFAFVPRKRKQICSLPYYKTEKGKIAIRKRRRKRYHKHANFIYEYKKARPCKCGQYNPAALQFHHRNAGEKEDNISSLTKKSLSRIIKEIEKCDVICGNCHAIHHWKPRKLTKKEQWLSDCKVNCGCKCGQKHPATLQFHHKHSEDKLINVSRALHRGRSYIFLKEEIAKCDVVCVNCHLILHWNEKHV